MLAGCESQWEDHEPQCEDHERLRDGKCSSAPPPCGEDPPGTCWEECMYGSPDTCWTVCASGDHGCPCWDEGHCQGTCFAEEYDSCLAWKTDGTCSSTTNSFELSCNCYIEEGIGKVDK